MSLCPAISGWALAHWFHRHAHPENWECTTPVRCFLRKAWIDYSIAHS